MGCSLCLLFAFSLAYSGNQYWHELVLWCLAAVIITVVGVSAVSATRVGVAAVLVAGDRVATLSVALPSDPETSIFL